MNEQLVQDILNLPFFEGKNVKHISNPFSLHIGVDSDTMLFLPAQTVDEDQIPSYSLYASTRGVIKMDSDNDRIVIIYDAKDGAVVEKPFKLSTYNLEQHKQSGSVLSYDIITVLHAINEIIAFNTGE